MANRCAADVGDAPKAMLGFGMFYRLLVAQAIGGDQLLMSPLPRITPDTRDIIVTEIDEKGPDAFTFEAVEDLERNNPELLQMAHNFALRQSDYVGVMQGFALLYKSLVLEASRERGRSTRVCSPRCAGLVGPRVRARRSSALGRAR